MVRRRATLVLSIVAALILVISVLVPTHGLLPFSVCGFRWLTELPCPLCGLTRAFSSIGHGDMGAAWRYHPLSFALYALTIAAAAVPLMAHVAPGATTRVVTSPQLSRALCILGLGVLIFGVLRIIARVEPV